jgi:hypothetical protein
MILGHEEATAKGVWEVQDEQVVVYAAMTADTYDTLYEEAARMNVDIEETDESNVFLVSSEFFDDADEWAHNVFYRGEINSSWHDDCD